MGKKYMKYTQDKIDFVHAMFGNNFPNSITIRGFKEQFNESINDRQIDYMMKEKTPTHSRVQYEKQMQMEINRAAKAFSFTLKEEVETIPEEVPEVIETIVSEVIGETIREPRFTRTRSHWTQEEEFSLVCNYYELSIDEARDLFQRPYYAISKRLENIVDSAEPKHIELLMKATKVIQERKKVAAKESSMGYWKRRQMRKTAKRIAKLNKQLLKLRGE